MTTQITSIGKIVYQVQQISLKQKFTTEPPIQNSNLVLHCHAYVYVCIDITTADYWSYQ